MGRGIPDYVFAMEPMTRGEKMLVFVLLLIFNIPLFMFICQSLKGEDRMGFIIMWLVLDAIFFLVGLWTIVTSVRIYRDKIGFKRGLRETYIPIGDIEMIDLPQDAVMNLGRNKYDNRNVLSYTDSKGRYIDFDRKQRVIAYGSSRQGFLLIKRKKNGSYYFVALPEREKAAEIVLKRMQKAGSRIAL